MDGKTKYRTAPDHQTTGWPPGVPYIIGNEGCERFSFYGMRSILYVYLTGLMVNVAQMSASEAQVAATENVHLFFSAVYAFPLIGAILADRYWGKYRTIMILSLVYCCGHLALAVFENPAWQERLLGDVWINPLHGMYLGLALIAIGSGGIKPCVSANVGDQFGKGNWHLLPKVFNAFYFIINFGSLFSTLLMPFVRGRQLTDPDTGIVTYTGSAAWAFGIPGILMGLATFFFWAGRHKYVHVPPSQPGKLGLLDVLAGTALFAVIAVPIFGYEFILSRVHETRAALLWTSAGSLIGLLTFFALFLLRQRIKQDDGFLAVMIYCLGARLRGGRRRNDAPQTKDNADRANSADMQAGTGDEDQRYRGHWFFGPAVERFGPQAAEGPAAVLRIMTIFIFISVFWSLFDQHSSTWIEQARHMDRTIRFTVVTGALGGAIVGGLCTLAMGLTLSKTARGRLTWTAAGLFVGGVVGSFAHYIRPFELQADQVPAANPFLVMLLIPYTSFGLYPLMRGLGFEPTPLRRITIGMFIASLSFAVVAILQTWLDAGHTLHVAWQMIAYMVITIAEVMVSITGLEFAYSQAPRRMKSVIMGFWSFNVTLGNVLVAYIARAQQAIEASRGEPIPLAMFFWVFCGLMALAAALFGIRAMFYQYRDQTQ